MNGPAWQIKSSYVSVLWVGGWKWVVDAAHSQPLAALLAGQFVCSLSLRPLFRKRNICTERAAGLASI